MSPFVNLHSLPAGVLDARTDCAAFQITMLPNLLSQNEVSRLNGFVDATDLTPVGHDGILKNYTAGDPIGSWRLSFLDDDFAAHIAARIVVATGRSATVNALFRVIRYEPGGLLIPHYDAPYADSTTSLVMYLDGGTDGSTEFLLDDRYGETHAHEDRPGYDAPVLTRVHAVAGSAVLFPHSVLHRGEATSVRKTIIRTDVVFA